MNGSGQNQDSIVSGQQTGSTVGDGGSQPVQPQPDLVQPVAGGEEKEPIRIDQEKVPLVEVGGEHEKIPEEVEGWLEKLEKGETVKLPQPVTHKGKTLVEPAEPQVVEKIVLPITQDAVQKGIHLKIIDSARWLAEWCLRIIKKFHGAVVYRES
jgi:hypothetical protein